VTDDARVGVQELPLIVLLDLSTNVLARFPLSFDLGVVGQRYERVRNGETESLMRAALSFGVSFSIPLLDLR
jgi:hypothetical protein